MGIRFRKRIRIVKGLTLNLGRSGASWTIGRPGASVNVRGDKVTGTVGISGTGVSYRRSLGRPGTADVPGTRHRGVWILFWTVLAAVVVYALVH